MSQNVAAGHEVRPTTDFLPEYKDKHRIIVAAIEALPPSTPTEERLARYEREMGRLKAEFRNERTAEYESKAIELVVSHSCSNGGSGGVKDCGWKCVDIPSPDLHTRNEWMRQEGTVKGISVSATQLCMRQTRAGRGSNGGTVRATFRYHPDAVIRLVKRDERDLFLMIVGISDVTEYVDERRSAAVEHVELASSFELESED